MLMRSLQARLGVSLIVSLIVLFTLEWRVVSPAIQSLTDDYVASRLGRDMTNLLAILSFGGDGAPEIATTRLDPSYMRPFSGHYFQLRTAAGRLVRSRSLWDEALHFPMIAAGETSRRRIRGPKGQKLLLLVGGFQKQGHTFTVAVAEDLAPLGQELWRFEGRYVVVSLTILVLLMGIQTLIVRLSLTPLRRLRRDIGRLERGEITQLGETVPTEIAPLVREMNRLLRIMEQRLRRSRNALGNLAHALKTPLTLVMQVAEHEDMRSVPAARAQLIEHTAVLRRRLDRELRRARLAGGAPAGQRLILADELSQLVRALQGIYQEKRLDIACCLQPGIIFTGDREDCLELLGNLLENACQWARHRIIVSAQETSKLLLTIEDDGSGCPPEVLDRLAQRGVRLDESSAGHGLGLAIAKDIVEQYGGTIHFGRSRRLGGFLVQVILPGACTSAEA
jgi:signal transduction histidine kinase